MLYLASKKMVSDKLWVIGSCYVQPLCRITIHLTGSLFPDQFTVFYSPTRLSLFYSHTGKHIVVGCTVDLCLWCSTVAPLVWHCTLPLQSRWGLVESETLVSPCLDMLRWLLLSQCDKLTLDHRHHMMHILSLPTNWHEFIERGNDSENLLLSVRLDSSNVDSLSEVISQL